MSNSLPFNLELSHQGSSDQRHVKEAPWTLKVKWDAVRMSGQSPLDFGKSFGEGKLYKLNGNPIMPLKYYGKVGHAHQEVALTVEFPAHVDPEAFELWTMEITIADALGKKGSVTYDNASGDMFTKIEKGALVLQFWVNDLLKKLSGKVNNNLLSAKVALTAYRTDNGNEVSGTATTAIPLHILLQKVIVLLPGVMASSLWVNDTKCYPGLTGVPAKLRLLACGDDGEPVSAAEIISFVTPGNPYATADWEKLLNAGLPTLTVLVNKNSFFSDEYATLSYYSIQGYPYDWRLKATKIIEVLFGAEATVHSDFVPTTFACVPQFFVKRGVKPLSLLTIRKYWRLKCPFLHDKLSLMGHSTGAAIMNRIVRDDRASDIVDKAFFVAAPFYGALKAYNAFLKGTMNLGAAESFVIEKNEMLKLGKNLPVLYFLMPNASYPAPVVEITPPEVDGKKAYYRTNAAAEAMTAILDFASVHNIVSLTQNAVMWNQTLATLTTDFCTSCRDDITIGETNCVVYWSTMGPQSTIGTILYNASVNYSGAKPEDRITYRLTGGDGTVPSESLRGSFPETCLFQVKDEGCLDHVAIITAKSLWKKTAETLGDVLPKEG